MFQSQEDKCHVSEQCLSGCGQRPWDHHLENRGELGWMGAEDSGLLKALHTPWSLVCGSTTVRGSSNGHVFRSLTPPGCSEQAGDRWRKRSWPWRAGLQAKIGLPFIQPSAFLVNALEGWVGPKPRDTWPLLSGQWNLSSTGHSGSCRVVGRFGGYSTDRCPAHPFSRSGLSPSG